MSIEHNMPEDDTWYSQPGGFDLSFMNDQTDSNYLIYNDGIFHSNSEVTFVSIDDVTSHSGLNDLDFEYASYLLTILYLNGEES